MHTGFLAQGAVRFVQSQIAGTINCDGGHFENAGGVAFTLEGAEIGRNANIGGGVQLAAQLTSLEENRRCIRYRWAEVRSTDTEGHLGR